MSSYHNIADYQQESARLQTFQNWPDTAYVGPEELAQAGFVYLGSGDRVQVPIYILLSLKYNTPLILVLKWAIMFLAILHTMQNSYSRWYNGMAWLLWIKIIAA